MKRRALLPLAIALVVLLPLRAAQQNPPVFRSTTNIVALDVTAVDKDGKPIRGLKASDFVVTLDGQTRDVQTLSFIEFRSTSTSTAPADPAPAAPAARATPAAPSATERRVVAFLFDDLSLNPLDGRSLTVAAARQLKAFGPDDLVGVTSISGLLPMVNPTTDRAAVSAAMAKMIGRDEVNPTAPFYISPLEAAEIDRGIPQDTLGRVAGRECPIVGLPADACIGSVRGLAIGYNANLRYRAAAQMEAYKLIIAALKPFKGAKVVIVLSGGVPQFSDYSATDRQLEPIMREAAESGVRFYAMAEEPDLISMSTTQEQNRARISSDRALFDGLASASVAAGGEAFRVIGQGDRFITRIEAETSAIYRLGIEAPPNATSARYLNAKVSVKRPGVTVRANRKALSASAAPIEVPVEDQLRNAVSYGGVDIAVPITIATAVRRELSGSNVEIGVNVQMPADVAGPVTTMFSLVDPEGKSVRAGRKVLPPAPAGEPYFMTFPLPVTAGQYRLRVSAADANGRVGSAEQPVGAELKRLGNFTISQVLNGWTSPNGERLLALEALPAGVETIHASVELYPDDAAAMATAIRVRFDFARVGEKTAILTREVEPLASGMVLTARMDVPVVGLAPGSYSLTATVLQGGVEKGAVSSVIRKSVQ